MQIPYAILKAKERAAVFDRRVEQFRSAYPEPSRERSEELHRVLEEFGFSHAVGWQRGWQALTTVVDLALQWAVKSMPPPIDALREARACLEAASAEWANAWGELAWFVKGRGLEASLSGPINDSATMAQAEWTRVSATLEMTMVKRKNVEESAPPKKPRKPTVELDDDLARQIRVIAGALDMSVPDYVNNRLRPIVQQELPGVLDAMGLGPTPRK